MNLWSLTLLLTARTEFTFFFIIAVEYEEKATFLSSTFEFFSLGVINWLIWTGDYNIQIFSGQQWQRSKTEIP